MPSRRSWWLALRLALLLAVVYVGVQVVLANSSELSGTSHYLDDPRWSWVGVALIAETLSYVNFTFLQRRLLGAGGVRIGFVPLAAMSLAGGAISNSIPGGGAFATVFAYRQFRRRGADEALTTWTIVAFTALTSIALALLAVVGLLIAGSDSGIGGLWLLVAPLVALPVLGVAVLLRPHLIEVILAPVLRIERVRAVVLPVIERLGMVEPSLEDWVWGLLFAAGNWVADMLCLAAAFAAVGAHVPWRGLLVAYGAAQVVSNVPITPGGLGVVEGSLTVALVAFGGSTVQTVAAVLLYRIISFWLTMPLGYIAWLGLHLDARRLAPVLEEVVAA